MCLSITFPLCVHQYVGGEQCISKHDNDTLPNLYTGQQGNGKLRHLKNLRTTTRQPRLTPSSFFCLKFRNTLPYGIKIPESSGNLPVHHHLHTLGARCDQGVVGDGVGLASIPVHAAEQLQSKLPLHDQRRHVRS